MGGKCKSDGVILGQPCDYSSGFVTINLNNASGCKLLKIYDPLVTYTVYFAPNCRFFIPKEGEVVVQPSMPLYRFLKGKQKVEIEFAVFGAKQSSKILLRKEENRLCSWNGNVEQTKNKGCKDMTIDEAQNRMIFKVTISRDSNEDYVTYSWGPPAKPLTVTLDWNREGEAPEVAECKSRFHEKSSHRTIRVLIH
ncbi:hypothetical protein EGR_10910 [Echinococcus granulosus]|uniref:DUF5727 domain-containing protein n=1 Tax=Echinococcus granulosus TaxID=6210 RepID=W6TZI0_ECHGR|nr:hypothetical protein EGR_10910 [Echinococcus granulosus]EUB54230.1 hypothetical protein EGR_10910 [Echinococcus granulosus]